MTNPDLVAARIAAETQQASTLNSFVFKLDGKPITANEIDDTLATNRNLVPATGVKPSGLPPAPVAVHSGMSAGSVTARQTLSGGCG